MPDLDVKRARHLLRAIIAATDTDDFRVNGLDKRNRERLVRAIARNLKPAEAQPTWHRPVCPNCGSEDVREWDKVSTSYYVGSISSDGQVEIADSSDTAWDSCEFDELMCRDCDYQNADPKVFMPETDVAKLVKRALREQDPSLALWFTPGAIRQHFDDDDDDLGEAVEKATDEQLLAIGQNCIGSDRLYDTFHSLLRDLCEEALL